MTELINNPTSEMAALMPAACNGCGAWAQLGKLRLCHVCHNARHDALEQLREVAVMYKEQLPAEVREALDAAALRSGACEDS